MDAYSEVGADHFTDEVKQKCAVEIISKITNCCKKDWDTSRKRLLQHTDGHVTTLNLCDILKAHVAK